MGSPAGSGSAALAPDAAVALGIAATAMPFARTAEGEAERWLRVLRLHGQAGEALQALGVSEGPVEGSVAGHAHDAAATGAEEQVRDPVAQVTECAVAIAGRRHAAGVGTRDLLLAVMEIYGERFDRVLHAHGTDREDVLEELRFRAAEG